MAVIHKSTPLGFAAIISAVLIWGSSFIVKGELLPAIDAVQIVFLQSFLAVPLLGLFICFEKKSFRISIADMLFIMVSVVLGIALCQILVNYSIGLIGGVNCSIIVALIPAMCLLVDIGVFKKPLNAFSAISIVASFAGIALIVSAAGGGTFSLLGYLVMFSSNIVWIYYCYFTNRRQTTAASTVFLFYQLVGCSIVLAPYMLLHPVPLAVFFDAGTALRMVYMVVLHGMLAYILFIYSVTVLDVVIPNIVSNLIPIVALLCAYLFYGELITVVQAAGTALVIFAVMLSSRAVDK